MNSIKVGLEPAFAKIISKIENRQPLMQNISGIMLDEVQQNFISEGRPPWRALSEKTIKDRKSKGYWPGRILQRTGILLRSVHSRSDNDSAIVGTNVKYAALHQFGSMDNPIRINAQSSLYKAMRYKKNSGKHKKGQFRNGKRTAFGQGFTLKARTIMVPPRPFLTISDQGMKSIEQAIMDYIKK